MPGLGAESKLGAISSLFGLDKVKIKPVYVDKALHGQQDALTASLTALRGSNAGDLAKYESAFGANTGLANKLSAEDVATLTGLIGKQSDYDATDNYERIRSGNLSALGDWSKTLADYGASADKLSMAARGYGGRAGDGGYGSILRQDRVSRNIAPVINTIFGSLGRDAASTSADQYRNLLSSLGLMQARQDAAASQANRLLDPISARMGVYGSENDALGQMIANAKANTAGYQSETSNWDRFLKGMGRSVDQKADTAIQVGEDVLSMYSGAGMFGGIGGGGGGGGGGGQQSMPAPAGNDFFGGNSYMPAPAYNAPQAPYSPFTLGGYNYGMGASPYAYNPGAGGGWNSAMMSNYNSPNDYLNPAAYR